jgi:hypothetical protein
MPFPDTSFGSSIQVRAMSKWASPPMVPPAPNSTSVPGW